jgi:phage terminase small subunit
MTRKVESYRPGERPLSDREERFVAEYMIDLNAQAALVRAGFNVRYPAQRASKLIADPRIKAAIAHAQAERAERTQTDADWVLRQAREVYERVVQQVEPALHPKTRRQLKTEDGRPLFTFNAAAALRALEIIGKHVSVQAFEERVSMTADKELVEILQARGRQVSREPIDITPEARRIAP